MISDITSAIGKSEETELLEISESGKSEVSELSELLKLSELADQNPLNIQKSFIVQAPAGSGKTSLLTQRLLILLGQTVNSPEECLCLTFTRKAAAEMRDRVLNALTLAQEIGEEQAKALKPNEILTLKLAKRVLERDQLLNWNLLKNPNRLQIQTIDSLCASLAQKMPLLSGLGAKVSIIKDALPLYLEASTQLLKRVEEKEEKNIDKIEDQTGAEEQTEHSISNALHCLLSHCDNSWEAVLQLLAEMLAKRDQWLLALGTTFFNIPDRNQLEQSLKNVIEEILGLAEKQVQNIAKEESSTSSLSKCSEIFALINFAAQHIEDQNSSIKYCSGLTDWPGKHYEELPKWLGLAEFLLTEKNQWRKTVTHNQGFIAASTCKNPEDKVLFKSMKDRMQALLLHLNDYPDFLDALKNVRDCPPPFYTDEQWSVVQALLSLLPHLVAELLVLFQKQNHVDFIEVALSAHRALGEGEELSDLGLKLGYQLKHVLVDEFQDTSLTQYLLLEKLTRTFSEYEGNTLFFVGDPQQSIYRFRRAEVGLFIEAKNKGLNDIKLLPITLTTNYRSNKKIIDWVNLTFSALFPKSEDHLLGAIPYSPSSAHETSSESASETNLLNAVILENVTPENETELLIKAICEIKSLNPEGSIAILVRSRSHLKSIIPALIKHHIAFKGVELDKLETRPLIRDLSALAKSMIHLSDRIAWLSLLRAPYAQICLKDIELIANHKPNLPLMAALIEYHQIPDLDSETKSCLAKLVPILNQAVEERGRVSFVKLIKSTWKKLFSLCTTKPYLIVDEEYNRFFDLCRELEKNQEIYQIGVLEEKLESLYTSMNVEDEEKSAVFIMTIHKSKGLEFDTVLLPGLGRKETQDSNQLLLWEERRFADGKPYLVLGSLKSAKLKKDPIYEYLRKQVQKRSKFESQRLLYVAATRAKRQLYCFVHNDFLENSETN